MFRQIGKYEVLWVSSFRILKGIMMGIQKRILKKKYWEYLIPVLLAASLLISCIIVSSKKFFWNDELFSYYLLNDRSLTHMLLALNDRINVSPPLYFIMGWLWDKGFGSSEISLRLFSSLGIIVACITAWLLLRRIYGFWSASIGILSVFCTSELIFYHNAESRMYGLFLAVCSLGMFQFDILNRRIGLLRGSIFANSFIHILIVQSHLFGILYSSALLFAFIVQDVFSKVFRLRIYLSVILAWFSLLFYIPTFIKQSDASNPRSWYFSPEISDLLKNLLFESSSYLILIILALILISGLNIITEKETLSKPETLNPPQKTQISGKLSTLILAFTFLAVPVFIWCFSRSIRPIYWYRYMIPSTLSWSILVAHLSLYLISPFQNFSIASLRLRRLTLASQLSISALLVTMAAILLIKPVLDAKRLTKGDLPGSNDSVYGYEELPIVTQVSHDFIKRLHYSPQRARYFFILDWEAAVDETSGRFTPSEYKNIEALNRNYPEFFHDNVVLSENFLNTYDRFLVLDYLDYNKKCSLKDFHCPQWLEMRVLNNPKYQISELGKVADSTFFGTLSRELLLVESKRK